MSNSIFYQSELSDQASKVQYPLSRPSHAFAAAGASVFMNQIIKFKILSDLSLSIFEKIISNSVSFIINKVYFYFKVIYFWLTSGQCLTNFLLIYVWYILFNLFSNKFKFPFCSIRGSTNDHCTLQSAGEIKYIVSIELFRRVAGGKKICCRRKRFNSWILNILSRE